MTTFVRRRISIRSATHVSRLRAYFAKVRLPLSFKQGFCGLNGLFASSVTLKLFLQGWQKKNSLIASSQKRKKKKKKKKGNKKSKKAYNTWYSQAVTHPSTNPARQGLTSVIGREPVLSLWYGRRQEKEVQI